MGRSTADFFWIFLQRNFRRRKRTRLWRSWPLRWSKTCRWRSAASTFDTKTTWVLTRRRSQALDSNPASLTRSAVMSLFYVSAVRPPTPHLCGTHTVWDEPAGKTRLSHSHTPARARTQFYRCVVFQTTDENWKACILNEAAKIIYKVMISQSADQLHIYTPLLAGSVQCLNISLFKKMYSFLLSHN